MLGVVTALVGYLLLARRSVAAGIYVGGALAVMPTLVRQACGASSEGAALLWALVVQGYLLVRVATPRHLESLLREVRAAANVSTRTTVVLQTFYENRPVAHAART